MSKIAALLSCVKPFYVRYEYQKGKRYHTTFFTETERFLLENDIEVGDKFYKRISKYLMNTQMVYLWFGTLRGEKLTAQEELTSLYLSGFIPMYDDFNDDHGLRHEDIMQLLEKPYNQLASEQKLFKFFYEKSLEHFADKALFSHYLEKVGLSQNDSLEQKSGDLGDEDLMKVTTDKGGYSLLFLRAALDYDISENERNAIFLLGQLIQLLDDLFDVYKDTLAGIKTVPNSAQDIKELRALFSSHFQQTVGAFEVLKYPAKNKAKFANQLRFFIAAGMVCLDQFELLQQQSNGVFSPTDYSRSQLICDMEKPSNMMNSLRYLFKGF